MAVYNYDVVIWFRTCREGAAMNAAKAGRRWLWSKVAGIG